MMDTRNLMISDCRSPRGERGLKSRSVHLYDTQLCRSPRGERGLKFEYGDYVYDCQLSRSPRGERGLKSVLSNEKEKTKMSLPTRGAWIEIHV